MSINVASMSSSKEFNPYMLAVSFILIYLTLVKIIIINTYLANSAGIIYV